MKHLFSNSANNFKFCIHGPFNERGHSLCPIMPDLLRLYRPKACNIALFLYYIYFQIYIRIPGAHQGYPPAPSPSTLFIGGIPKKNNKCVYVVGQSLSALIKIDENVVIIGRKL